MKNKKGFTLTELIAVIAIISVLLLLLIPNVLKVYNNGKKNMFYDEILNIYGSVTPTYMYNVSEGNTNKRFCYGKDSSNNLLDKSEKNDLYYDVYVDSDGVPISILVLSDNFKYTISDSNGIKRSDISANDIVNAENDLIECDKNTNNNLLSCKINETKRKCHIIPFDYIGK